MLLAGAWLTGQAMEAMLYGVPAGHLPTVAGAALVLIAVALPACLWPRPSGFARAPD